MKRVGPPIVYVAGPLRGATRWEVEKNIRVAERLGLEVARLGAMPVIVHSMCRFFEGALPDEFWLEGDLEILRRSDALILTDDWRRSTGAKNERAEALRCGIPVFETLEQLAEWLRGQA